MSQKDNISTGNVLQHAVIEFLDDNNLTQKNSQKTTISSLAANALKAGDSSKKFTGMETSGTKRETIIVQYNPNTITFSASSKEKLSSEQESDYMVSTISAACTITMNVELIFYSNEAVDESVLSKMEPFLNIMKKNHDAKIRFSWADIMFEGEVVSIEVKYDMFNSKGNPISSRVKLSIQGKTEEHVLKKAYKNMEKERQNINVGE